MDKTENSPRFRLLVFFIVGLVVLIIFAAISESGLIGYWVPLGRPTERVSGLVTFIGGDLSPHLLVSGMDGRQFMCISPEGGCHSWEPRTEEMRVTREVGKYSCNLLHPRFTLFRRPFDEVADCLEILYRAGGYGSSRYLLVLDGQGDLWAGIFDEDSEEILLSFFLFSPIALLGSFFTALVWNFLSSRHPPGAQETRAAQRRAFRGWLWRTLRIAARVGSIPCFLYAYYALIHVGNLLEDSGTLLYSSIAVCMLIAWRMPLAGGISGMVCFLFLALRVGFDNMVGDFFSALISIWYMTVLLSFIGSSIVRTRNPEEIETPTR